MKHILVVLPQTDFDPTEVAVPWKAWTNAGQKVSFATETGLAATGDPVTLTGKGLPAHARSLMVRPENLVLYNEMTESKVFSNPTLWKDVRPTEYDAFHFPGGHAPGMKPYLESSVVQEIACAAFAADKPVSAICHGVIPLARAGLLMGRKTTSLTGMMEGIAVFLTRGKLGDHYRTYRESVENEVKRLLASPNDYRAGPMIPRYSTKSKPNAGFVVEDGNYISARWPGDAWTLAMRMLDRL